MNNKLSILIDLKESELDQIKLSILEAKLEQDTIGERLRSLQDSLDLERELVVYEPEQYLNYANQIRGQMEKLQNKIQDLESKIESLKRQLQEIFIDKKKIEIFLDNFAIKAQAEAKKKEALMIESSVNSEIHRRHLKDDQ